MNLIYLLPRSSSEWRIRLSSADGRGKEGSAAPGAGRSSEAVNHSLSLFLQFNLEAYCPPGHWMALLPVALAGDVVSWRVFNWEIYCCNLAFLPNSNHRKKRRCACMEIVIVAIIHELCTLFNYSGPCLFLLNYVLCKRFVCTIPIGTLNLKCPLLQSHWTSINWIICTFNLNADFLPNINPWMKMSKFGKSKCLRCCQFY